jgi:hypothetical protein
MIAMTGLALLGTAGAIGYREMFGGSVIATSPPIITASNEPNKVAPVSGEPQAKNSGNARQDGADTTAKNTFDQEVGRSESSCKFGAGLKKSFERARPDSCAVFEFRIVFVKVFCAVVRCSRGVFALLA